MWMRTGKLGGLLVPLARATRDRGSPSPRLMVRLGVPVGGRVRKLRAVEDQSVPITMEKDRQAWREHVYRSMCAVGDRAGHPQ